MSSPTCQVLGCGATLRCDNRSGYCRAHHGLSQMHKQMAAIRYVKNRDRAKRLAAARKLRVKYGITLEQKVAILTSQGGVCAICGVTQATKRQGRGDGWRMDHNHATGALRGVLCHNCNIGLGHFMDDATRLQSAIAYLGRHA
jgi:hypothetical protein